MSAKPTHDLAVKAGEYTDRAGERKGRWVNIGTVFKHDDGGTSLKLDAIPVGLPSWDGWVSVFPRKERTGQPPRGNGTRTENQPAGYAAAGRMQAPQGFDDEIPF